MTTWTLILRSLRHYRRTHLGVVLGSACAAAVLVGALVVGNSVRVSLREQALARIGVVDAVLAAGERFFRSDLADRLAADLDGVRTAPVLLLRGVASAAGSSARAGIVEVHGVDGRFFSLRPRPGGGTRHPRAAQAWLNERLATQLGVRVGDTVVLRVEKPGFLPRDLAMAKIEDVSLALRVQVAAVIGPEEFGDFGLRASQVPPFNVFVSLSWLQRQLDLGERANLLLLGNAARTEGLAQRADDALARRWVLADAELRVNLPEGQALFELTSDRIFIEQPVIDAAARIDSRLVGVLTYFVNALRIRERETPYSMVSALGPLADIAPDRPHALVRILNLLPHDLGEAGIVLNEWLAHDLKAKVGDTIELDYFVMGPELSLVEEKRAFRVHAVTPISGAAADPDLMPEFPGLSDSENCRDWEPGFPIDLKKIRDVDEKYWDDYRGTPKAFLSLAAGRSLWSNRFGSLTAIRGPAAAAQRMRERLPRELDPASVGLFFRDVRGPALAGGAPATDFGGLFLGLSFFLIVAALLLTALLHVFGVEQRANEIGTLLALGFLPSRVRRLFLGEAAILALAGGVLGAALGIGYTLVVLQGLGTIWRDAVGQTTLNLHAGPGFIAVGALIAVVTAVVAMALALRKAFDRPALELLTSRGGIPGRVRPPGSGRGRVSLGLAVGCVALAAVIVFAAGAGSEQAAGAFFGAGSLLLVGGLAACRRLLGRFGKPSDSGIASVAALGLRNTGRRAGRSLATIALLASGTFLVVAVQAYRLEPPRDFTTRSAGTGGFALFGRSALPVLRDLGTSVGREAFGLDAAELDEVSIVPLRVRDGDDASCLNLNRPQNPRLVGVRPSALAERGAFTFANVLQIASNPTQDNPWLLLDRDWGEDVVPAIGDQASVLWSLHKKLGDTLQYRDERGRPFRVRIVATVANSILQGNLIISEEHIKSRFPSVGGFRMFLIDAPADRVPEVAAKLTLALEDIGLELTTTAERLQAFNEVQNTYLLIFQALGGLGLLLGSVGLGTVVLRNALERRSELALVSAVGFPARALRSLIWSEHGLLLGLGLVTGILAAAIAVLPGLRESGDSLISTPLVLLVLAVASSGALWVWLASVVATRGPLMSALRED